MNVWNLSGFWITLMSLSEQTFTQVGVCPHSPASSAMTLNKGDKLRNMDKRRGSMPFPMNIPNLHRRSMPVDDRDLRSTMPQTGQTDELSNLLRCASFSQDEQHRGSCASDSSDSVISTGSEAESQVYKVVLLGEHGVGKSSLARVFGGVEDAGHDCDEAGKWWCCCEWLITTAKRTDGDCPGWYRMIIRMGGG